MVRRPSRRARAAQWVLLGVVVTVAWFLVSVAASTSGRRTGGFGFGYLADPTNFDIPFRLISWTVGDTYARALLVCVLNTLLVSAMSIVAGPRWLRPRAHRGRTLGALALNRRRRGCGSFYWLSKVVRLMSAAGPTTTEWSSDQG